jgi:NhaP-type Na+/H+ or K+/H+ antiporter
MADALSVETLACLILVVLFLLFSVTLHKLSERKLAYKLVHESGICILLGLLTGTIYYFITGKTTSKFNTSLFFQFMLPALMFGLGYNMKRRRFFRNIAPIVTNGIIGTLLNFIILSTLAWFFCNTQWVKDDLPDVKEITLLDSLYLGAVLSSPETVATLSLLRENKTPKLHSIIFGENIVGTAINILLVKTIQLVHFSEMSVAKVFEFIGYFLLVFVGSLLLGCVMGFISALMTKTFRRIKNNPSKEVALQFYIAWTGYLISSMIGISGVITILICAIISSHYAYYNMTSESRLVVNDTFYLFGDGMRGLVFAYLGLTAFTYSPGSISIPLSVLLMISIILSRFVSTFGLAYVLKLINKRKYFFDPRTLSVIWIGGLFRGTIAFGLIVSIDVSNKNMLQVTVLYLIIFSMTLYSIIMPLWISCVRPSEVVIENLSVMEAIADGDYRKSYFGSGRVDFLMAEDFRKKRNWLHRQWRDLDNNYLKPCLINKESLDEQKRMRNVIESQLNPSLKGVEIEEVKEQDEEDSLSKIGNSLEITDEKED